jgi:hypothetical protein
MSRLGRRTPIMPIIGRHALHFSSIDTVSIALAASVTLTVSSLDNESVATSFAAPVSLSVGALDLASAVVALAGIAGMTVGALDTEFPTVSFAAPASLSILASDTELPSVALAAAATLVISASDQESDAVSLTAPAVLTVSATDIKNAAVALVSTATLSATPTVTTFAPTVVARGLVRSPLVLPTAGAIASTLVIRGVERNIITLAQSNVAPSTVPVRGLARAPLASPTAGAIVTVLVSRSMARDGLTSPQASASASTLPSRALERARVASPTAGASLPAVVARGVSRSESPTPAANALLTNLIAVVRGLGRSFTTGAIVPLQAPTVIARGAGRAFSPSPSGGVKIIVSSARGVARVQLAMDDAGVTATTVVGRGVTRSRSVSPTAAVNALTVVARMIQKALNPPIPIIVRLPVTRGFGGVLTTTPITGPPNIPSALPGQYPWKYISFIPDQRWWEIEQERYRQTEALLRVGEWAGFATLWSRKDFDQGLAQRCPNCITSESLVNQVYLQPTFERCPVCFGSLFVGAHGGVKAFLIRPTIWQFSEEQTAWLPRGEVQHQTGMVTTTGDFRSQVRDFIFRGDGQRFSITSVTALHLSAGNGIQAHTNSAISMSYNVGLENPDSPAYLIETDDATSLIDLLNTPYNRLIPDWTPWEFIDGPVSV